MIYTTVLQRLLVPQREGRKSARGGGFAIPALGELPADPEWAPIFSTNMVGSFVEVKIGAAGQARFGFSEVDFEGEFVLLRSLVESLRMEAPTLPEAFSALRAVGLEPYHAVVPRDKLFSSFGLDVPVEEIDTIISSQGYLSLVEGVRLLVEDVPKALVVAHPSFAGFYIRSDTHLGLMLTRTDTAWCTVSL